MTAREEQLRAAAEAWLDSHGEADIEERLAEAANEWLEDATPHPDTSPAEPGDLILTPLAGQKYGWHGNGDLCLGSECAVIDADGDHPTADVHSNDWYDGYSAGQRDGADTSPSEPRVFELDDGTGWRAVDDETGMLADAATAEEAIAKLATGPVRFPPDHFRRMAGDCDCVPGHRCDCWDYRADTSPSDAAPLHPENVGKRYPRFDNDRTETVYAIAVDHPAGRWEQIWVLRSEELADRVVAALRRAEDPPAPVPSVGSLDAAWAEAEAALPPESLIRVGRTGMTATGWATAYLRGDLIGTEFDPAGPAAALRKLTAVYLSRAAGPPVEPAE